MRAGSVPWARMTTTRGDTTEPVSCLKKKIKHLLFELVAPPCGPSAKLNVNAVVNSGTKPEAMFFWFWVLFVLALPDVMQVEVIRTYTAKQPDELSLQVADVVLVSQHVDGTSPHVSYIVRIHFCPPQQIATALRSPYFSRLSEGETHLLERSHADLSILGFFSDYF